MSEFNLNQSWIASATSDDADDVSVIGMDLSMPMPTEEEFKAAFKAEYVKRFIEFGLPADFAEATFEAGDWEDIKDGTPQQAADDEMYYMSEDDGTLI